ncbi:MAG: ABC transporter permease [Bacteroidales bacterium]|nr:ABC transporter permease [Bacteroidales bacterium]
MQANNINDVKRVFVRELRRMVSRPIYLLMTILIPLGFLLFFGTFMPEGLPERLPIGIVDQDHSSLSRNIIRQIDATQQTRVVAHYLHYSDARNALQKGEIFAFITIPDKLMSDVMSGLQPTIDFYYNETFLIPGSLVLKNLSTLLTTISAGANLQSRQARGQTPEASMGQIQPIAPEFHALGNPYVNYSVYLIQVLLPGLLQLMILIATVYCIGIELKKNSSAKWLRIARGSFFKALLGKLLPYTIVFTCMAFIYDIFLFKIMHYPLNNSIAWMFLASFFLVIAAQAIATLMIGVFPVLRDGLSFAGLYGVLAFSYSGLSFPIEGMPALLQGLSYLFPLRWFFKVYQGIALNGTSPVYSIPYYVLMLLFLLLPLLIAKRLGKAMKEQNYPKK